LVHAETSTGALQPMEGMADVDHHHGGLLVIDCESLSPAPARIGPVL
jgi:alanine-glyoxylate transaminase/serine-glyoxylate transaminase/serine-pyruvate transaminase